MTEQLAEAIYWSLVGLVSGYAIVHFIREQSKHGPHNQR